MTAEDEREFARFVREDPDAVFIARHSRISSILEFSFPEEGARREHINDTSTLLIWNVRICENVKIVQYSPDNFAINENNQNLIEFSRSLVHDRTMLQGRLHVDMYALDEAGQQFVHKGKEFERW